MFWALQRFTESARVYCAWCEGTAGDEAAEVRAADEWRSHFSVHRGRPAAGALYSLHRWLVDDGAA